MNPTPKSRGFNLLFAIALDRARGVRPGRRPADAVSRLWSPKVARGARRLERANATYQSCRRCRRDDLRDARQIRRSHRSAPKAIKPRAISLRMHSKSLTLP
jgi:hypothetical protein